MNPISVRNKHTWKGKGIYIGRPSPLGNRWVIGKDGNREEVIAQYREWLENLIARVQRGEALQREDLRAWQELQTLTALAKTQPLDLLCFCSPRGCHGDVIKEVIERLNLAGQSTVSAQCHSNV